MKVRLEYLAIAWKNRNVLLVIVDLGKAGLVAGTKYRDRQKGVAVF